jgi:hypothetical protein
MAWMDDALRDGMAWMDDAWHDSMAWMDDAWHHGMAWMDDALRDGMARMAWHLLLLRVNSFTETGVCEPIADWPYIFNACFVLERQLFWFR